MPSLAGLGNNTLVQIVLYQLVGQLLGAVLSPYGQAITNQVNAATPLVPLSPAELANLVERGEIGVDAAAAQARMSGIDGDRFRLLTRLAGQAPAPGDLAEALRRGIITRATYDHGVVQGNLRAEWADLVRKLAVRQPSPEAILNAYLEGQVTEDDARRRWAQLGGDPDYFDILYNTQGQAPTPTQALEMANRGLIPWGGRGPGVVSYEQSFYEGPWRNKWSEPFRGLAAYLPPPRTVTAMYKEGSLTHAEAASLLAKQGLTPALVEGYLKSGSAQKTEKSRDLAQSTILELYQDRLLPRDQAHGALVQLGYDAGEADFLVELEDTKVLQRFLNLAVGRMHTLYVGHKIDRGAVTAALVKLGLEGAGSADLVALWDWERAANVRQLTAAEVRQAFGYQIMDQATATAELVGLGFTPYDAWVYLSIGHHGKLGAPPPRDDIGPAPGLN